jgi:hypothetical protein
VWSCSKKCSKGLEGQNHHPSRNSDSKGDFKDHAQRVLGGLWCVIDAVRVHDVLLEALTMAIWAIGDGPS